jgi:hypothetical protein
MGGGQKEEEFKSKQASIILLSGAVCGAAQQRSQ